MVEWILPQWPASPRIRAVVTTRSGGFSAVPFDSFNLAEHVGDDPTAVARNRALLRDALGLPSEPMWLRQVHGCEVADGYRYRGGCEADAVVASRPGEVCAVLTADCLPILICDREGTTVSAVHAGWRGLLAGVIEKTLESTGGPTGDMLAWMGPAIGPEAFEVGADVREAFLRSDPADEVAFRASGTKHWLADIYALARRRMSAAGVGYIGGGEYCTVTDDRRFFSYRRDGVTGRMAALVWIE